MDGSIFLGHASVVAHVGDKRLAFDPHDGGDVFGGTWRFIPEPVKLNDPPDLIIVSHVHADHADPVVWERFPSVPIAIPDGRADLYDLVRRYRKVPLVLPLNESVWLCGARITAIPSDRNRIDCSFVLEAPSGFQLFHGNDCFLTHDTLVSVRNTFGFFDHVYAPASYVNWYPMCVETLDTRTKRTELQRVADDTQRTYQDYVDVLKPTVSVPCGANLAYMGDSQDMADAMRTPYECIERSELSEVPVDPNDAWMFDCPNPAALGVAARELIDSTRKSREVEPDVEFATPTINLASRARSAGVSAVLGDRGHLSVQNGTDVLHFSIEAPVWNQWVTGKITFDDVMLSMRFQVWRYPERYDHDLLQRLRRWL